MATSARTAVKAIQDIMRKDVGVDGDAQRLSQLCWLFFLVCVQGSESPGRWSARLRDHR